MTSVIISTPAGVDEESARERVQLQIVVADADFVGRFDRLEVWRADDQQSAYVELTAVQAQPARLPVDASDPPAIPLTGRSVNADGTVLLIEVDGVQLSISIEGTDPLSYAQIAVLIGEGSQSQLSAYTAVDGRLAVQTLGVGAERTLELLEGELAALVGLPMVSPSNWAAGRSARLPLIEGVGAYTFVDPNGLPDGVYRTRFSNSVNGDTSAFSLPFQTSSFVGVEQSQLVQGTLDLVRADGGPLADQEVRLRVETPVTLAGSKLVAGDDLVRLTDEQGHVEFTLVRGLQLTVAISGTAVIKRLTVPVDPTISTFSLLDPTVTDEDDWFKVRVPQARVAQRRTL